MSKFRIVCTDQEPITEPTTHAHITAVGVDTDNDGYADQRHSLAKVVNAIDSHTDTYYTYGVTSQKTALVETINCPHHCGKRIIRSTPDATRDNNLDYLRRCSWK